MQCLGGSRRASGSPEEIGPVSCDSSWFGPFDKCGSKSWWSLIPEGLHWYYYDGTGDADSLLLLRMLYSLFFLSSVMVWPTQKLVAFRSVFL